jgi:signal transduction histidine kinase
MFRYLTRQSAAVKVLESLLILLAITWLDLTTAHQVSLVLFYSVPIAFAVWLCDARSAFLIAGLAGVLWFWADIASGHPYPGPTVQAWEIAIRFAFFFLVALAGIGMKEQYRASQARIALLERAQKLEQQIIEVSEYEQQRIGRDLHDGLCQLLAAIRCVATSLKMDLEQRNSDELAMRAEEVEKLLGESVEQARNLAHGLVPIQLDEGGLTAALEQLAASTTRLFGVHCRFEYAGENGTLPVGKRSHLYRIAQEAINNATKHGKAHTVEIRLSANSSALSLSIADDGTGFSKTPKQLNGVGISIMRYRANALGGELEIEDRPSGGTVVSCIVPAGKAGQSLSEH